MTKTYRIQAWCLRPFTAWIELDAASPKAALAKARLEDGQLLDAAEDCNSGYSWEEFVVFDESGQMLLHESAQNARLRNAAPALLKALKELLADIDGLAGEFEICHEIIRSSYGKTAYAAIAEAEGKEV